MTLKKRKRTGLLTPQERELHRERQAELDRRIRSCEAELSVRDPGFVRLTRAERLSLAISRLDAELATGQ